MKEKIRGPAVSGVFYFSDSRDLKKNLENLFSGLNTKQDCKAVISPHAGYEFSGKTMAYALSSLRSYKKFIILGPNHTGIGYMFSIMSQGSWRTPLGDCKIDTNLAKKLKKPCGFLKEDELAHMKEHSIEVQLPFLQHKLKDFTFAPIAIMGRETEKFLEDCKTLGGEISKLMANGVGLIASSDFSHFLPREEANKRDSPALERIMGLDPEGFVKAVKENQASICGLWPITVLLYAIKELNLKPFLIHESNSGDATKDYSSIVSYKAIGFG